jgi:hypothetical protein
MKMGIYKSILHIGTRLNTNVIFSVYKNNFRL